MNCTATYTLAAGDLTAGVAGSTASRALELLAKVFLGPGDEALFGKLATTAAKLAAERGFDGAADDRHTGGQQPPIEVIDSAASVQIQLVVVRANFRQ